MEPDLQRPSVPAISSPTYDHASPSRTLPLHCIDGIVDDALKHIVLLAKRNLRDTVGDRKRGKKFSRATQSRQRPYRKKLDGIYAVGTALEASLRQLEQDPIYKAMSGEEVLRAVIGQLRAHIEPAMKRLRNTDQGRKVYAIVEGYLGSRDARELMARRNASERMYRQSRKAS